MAETGEATRRGSLLGRITALAHRFDQWLLTRVGRPYNIALGSGLVLSIVATAKGLFATVITPGNVIVAVAAVVFELALLINQLSQLHSFREAVRRRRAERRQ